jgi:hypothetical protein
MMQFQVYLRAELGKLRTLSEAEWFLRSVPAESIGRHNLPNDPAGLVKQLSTQPEVDSFVHGLSEENLRELAKTCDENWRKNGVYANLTSAETWTISEVPVEQVDLQQAEPSLGHVFQRNGFKLCRVAGDAELFTHPPYSGLDLAEPVVYPVCLAKFRRGRYRLFDGVHRAIRLVRGEAKSLTLCWADGPAEPDATAERGHDVN